MSKQQIQKWLVYLGLPIIYLIGLFVKVYMEGWFDFSNIIDDKNSMIMLAFFIIIFIVFAISEIGVINLFKAKTSLDMITGEIRNLENNENEKILTFLLEKENVFNNKLLNEQFKSFKKDLNVIQKKSSTTKADIEKYINLETLEGYFLEGYQSLIPGTMTGLGILGTFIGLSLGLKGFSLSPDATSSELISGILPLIDGIKIAFHTSIIGLIYSLLFSFSHHYLYREMEKSIESFLNLFEKDVIDETEKSSISSIILNQEKLVDLTAKMCDSNIKQTEALEAFEIQMQKDQAEELDKLVENFITKMNEALNDSFVEMGKLLKETNAWQKASLDEMKLVLSEVNNMAIDLKTINSDIDKAITSVKGYTDKCDKAQETIVNNINEFKSLVNISKEESMRRETILTSLMESGKQTSEAVVSYANIAKEQVEIIKDAENSSKEMLKEQLATFLNEIQQTCAASLEETKTGINQYGESVQSIANETISNITAVGQEAKDKIASINDFKSEVSEDMLKAADKLGEASNQLVTKVESYTKETMETRINEFSDEIKSICNSGVDEIKAGASRCSESVQSIANETISNITAVGQEAKDKIASINNFKSEVSEDMLKAADKLGEASNQLVTKVESYTKETMETRINEFSDEIKLLCNTGVDEIKAGASRCSESVQNIASETISDITTVGQEAKSKITDMCKFNSNISDGMIKAADKLGEASNQLGNNMEARTKETFTTFDTELSEITKHFSGTLKQMDKAIEKVPAIVDNMYSDIEDKFEKLNNSMDVYIEYADKLSRNMEAKWNQFHDYEN